MNVPTPKSRARMNHLTSRIRMTRCRMIRCRMIRCRRTLIRIRKSRCPMIRCRRNPSLTTSRHSGLGANRPRPSPAGRARWSAVPAPPEWTWCRPNHHPTNRISDADRRLPSAASWARLRRGPPAGWSSRPRSGRGASAWLPVVRRLQPRSWSIGGHRRVPGVGGDRPRGRRRVEPWWSSCHQVPCSATGSAPDRSIAGAATRPAAPSPR